MSIVNYDIKKIKKLHKTIYEMEVSYYHLTNKERKNIQIKCPCGGGSNALNFHLHCYGKKHWEFIKQQCIL